MLETRYRNFYRKRSEKLILLRFCCFVYKFSLCCLLTALPVWQWLLTATTRGPLPSQSPTLHKYLTPSNGGKILVPLFAKVCFPPPSPFFLHTKNKEDILHTQEYQSVNRNNSGTKISRQFERSHNCGCT